MLQVQLHGGTLFNNVNQGLAFAILIWQGVRIDKQLREHGAGSIKMNSHDEWTGLVAQSYVPWAKTVFEYWMTQTPPWLPETLPLACEFSSGQNYAEIG